MRSSESNFTGLELDATAIRVLAHPLRSRLLTRLRTDGPATATELADALATNTGATSYHLRKLESVGLVTDTGEGEGKRRQWRAATDFHSWTTSILRQDEDSATAMNWLSRDYVRQFAERAERWLDAEDGWPAEWVDALGLADTHVSVTPEQMAELQTRLLDLLAEYRTRAAGDPRGRVIALYTYALPRDTTPPDSPDSPDPAAS